MRMSKLPQALLLVACTLGATPAMAVVTGTTEGYYNNSLGDLGAPNGLLPWFPAPNTFSGTQDQIFASAPDLSGATASLASGRSRLS
jgi:hypothetical protein